MSARPPVPSAPSQVLPLKPDHGPHRDGWLVVVPTCASTNDWVAANLERLADGDCVWTERQTAGRGQRGRAWLSPPGVLTATYLLRMPAADASLLSLTAGLAVARSIEALVPDAAVAVKWPNDCYCHDRKLAGVLCRAVLRDGGAEALVGIGLNLDPRWSGDRHEREVLAELSAPPIAIADLVADPPAPRRVLAALRRELLAGRDRLLATDRGALLDELGRRDWLYGRRLRVTTPHGVLEGEGRGIAADGRLRVATADGPVAVASGRVRILPDRPAQVTVHG